MELGFPYEKEFIMLVRIYFLNAVDGDLEAIKEDFGLYKYQKILGMLRNTLTKKG